MTTLQQLEYIIAVDKYRHFVTASEKCFVTQPTLSMQIKKMEDDLGVLIFDRSKQPIIPTLIGEKIIEQAKEVLFQSKKIEEIILNEEQKISGTLKIAIIPSLAPYLLPKFIGTLTDKYPLVDISITELLSEEIIYGLKQDELDVGILVTPLAEKGIHEIPLFYEEMKIYLHPSHPFAHSSNLSTSEIATDELWLMSKGNCFRTQVVNLCDYKLENHKHFRFESGSLETLINLVNTEGGYTLLPELAANNIPKDSKGVLKQFTNIKPLREVGIVYSRKNVKSRLIEILNVEIRNSVTKEMHTKGDGQIVYWR